MDGKPGDENVDRMLNHAAYYSAIGVDAVRLYYRGGWGAPGFSDELGSEELAAWIQSGKLEI
eukprot:673463-Pyramimonas_sp.AAC.1